MLLPEPLPSPHPPSTSASVTVSLGRYQEALELLDNLKLLPSRSMSSSSGGSMRSSEDDGFTACIQRFSRLESPMKRLMDDVIVMAMDCIYGLYTTVPSSPSPSSSPCLSWL
jgi:hypothetical protein